MSKCQNVDHCSCHIGVSMSYSAHQIRIMWFYPGVIFLTHLHSGCSGIKGIERYARQNSTIFERGHIHSYYSLSSLDKHHDTKQLFGIWEFL